MAWPLSHIRAAGATVLVVTAASMYAAVLPVVLFSASYLYSLPLILATVFPLVLYASRNPRLFFFVGMIFTSQLGLSIHFRGHPHMGGTHAFSITLMDFFLVPLALFLLRDFYRGRRRRLTLSPVSAWWLALVALGLYTVAVGPFREMAATEAFSMLKNWLLFVIIVNECVREKHFQWAVGGLAANVVLNVLVAFLQFILKRDLGLQALGEASPESTMGANYGVYAQFDSVYRVDGLSGHANLLSAYLAMVLPILIGQLFAPYRWPTKVILATISVAGAIALGLTLSRSGWASFAVSLGFLTMAMFALPALRTRYLALKATMLAGIVGGGFVASGPVLRRFFESDPGALDFRLEWITVAWTMVTDRPILGFGLNTFVYQLQQYAPYTAPRMYELFGDLWPAVHNTYMLVWSEQGTIGLFIFLALHAQIFWIAIKTLRYPHLSEKVYMVSIGAACGVLAILVDGFSSFYVRIASPARTFWVVVGLLVAAYYWHVRNDAARARSQPQPLPADTPPLPGQGGLANASSRRPDGILPGGTHPGP
jgi:putative inorganic carbon (hco3(-)) transporter